MSKAIMKRDGKIDKILVCGSGCGFCYYNELASRYECNNLGMAITERRIPDICDLIDYEVAVKLLKK